MPYRSNLHGVLPWFAAHPSPVNGPSVLRGFDARACLSHNSAAMNRLVSNPSTIGKDGSPRRFKSEVLLWPHALSLAVNPVPLKSDSRFMRVQSRSNVRLIQYKHSTPSSLGQHANRVHPCFINWSYKTEWWFDACCHIFNASLSLYA